MDGLRVRTLEIAIAEARYGAEFGSLNERFWLGVDTALNGVQIGAGALALTGALQNWPGLVTAAGIALAVISGLHLTLHPMRRSVDFRDARRAFYELNARAPAMTLDELDAALEQLRATAPAGYVEALSMPALNIVNQQHGHAAARPLTAGEKLAMTFA